MARKYEGHAIGIDLGTSYSRVAVWREQLKRAEIIYSEASFVAFTNDRRLIGDSAKIQAASNPSNTIFDAKKFTGRKYSDPLIQNNLRLWPFEVISSKDDKPMILVNYKGKEKHIFPEEISSLIFKKMLDNAEAVLESPVKNAVITVPAYFNDYQRKATKDAAVIAGLNLVQIVNEPTAAALSYGLHKRATCVENRNTLIIDLGGGAFDVSLLSFKNDKFEIKAATKTQFGGEDFIDRMVKHYVKEFKKKHKIDISRNSRALRRLRTECERAKNTLSFDFDATIYIDAVYDGIDFYSSMSRAKFEQLNIDLFDNFMDTVKICLSDAKIYNSSVDEVVLVGGSSRVPKVQQLLEDFFNMRLNLFNVIDPDEAVACGAAIHAALLSGGLKNVPKEVHRYLTRLSLAESEPEQIPRHIVNDKKVNVTIADKKSKIVIDFQEGVGMAVNVPGSFNISLPDTALNLPINCCFATDSDGMLNVSAEIQTISKDIKITDENVRVEFRSLC